MALALRQRLTKREPLPRRDFAHTAVYEYGERGEPYQITGYEYSERVIRDRALGSLRSPPATAGEGGPAPRRATVLPRGRRETVRHRVAIRLAGRRFHKRQRGPFPRDVSR
jgi:hypothetical protein